MSAVGFDVPDTAKAKALEDQGWQAWLKTLSPRSFTAPFSEEHVEFWDKYWSLLMRQRGGEIIPAGERTIILPLGRGNAKCLAAETQIYLANGSRLAIRDIQPGTSIFSYNESTGEFEQDVISRKWKSGIRECVKVRTKSRHEVVLTAKHKVLTLDGWKLAGDLTIGDRIASPRKLPVAWSDKTHTDEEVRLLAYVIAEGNTTEYKRKGGGSMLNLVLTNQDAGVIEDIEYCAESLGFGVRRTPRDNHESIYLSGGARAWIRENDLNGKKSTNKRLPSWVFHLPERQKWQFLSAFIDTDGWISQKIGITLANQLLVEDLQYLTVQMGIPSTVLYRPNDHANAWALLLDSGYMKAHADKLHLRAKQSTLNTWVEKRRYSLTDTYPYTEMRGMPHGIGYAIQRAGLSISRRYDVTRAKMQAALALYSHPRWEQLEASEVFWDKVTCIEDAGSHETFDVEVEKNHNLVTNLLVTHNSTSAEMAGIAEGCILGKGYALYLSDSQILAEEHLYSVKAILENDVFSQYYPQMASPVIESSMGTSKVAKYRQDTIITNQGRWGMTARGITSNVRGGRIDTQRFTLVLVDDIDDLNDSLMVIEKKKRILSRTVFPAMSKDGKVIFAQNLITANSVASQILSRKTDILSERTVIGGGSGVKAFKEIELDQKDGEDGVPRWYIKNAVPTWDYFNIEDARSFLALSGKEAFLAEYQHEFDLKTGKVIPDYNEEAQVITWSMFEKVFGSKFIPKHWKAACGLDVGFSDGMAPHYSAWAFAAVSAMNSALPGKHFVYRAKSFIGTAIDDQAIEIWKDLVKDGDFQTNFALYPALQQALGITRNAQPGGLVSHWQMSHEATGVMMTLNSRYGFPFGKLQNYKATDGVAQWNNLCRCDYSKPNPFKPDEQLDGETYLIGSPSLFYIVDDDQLVNPRDDNGMKLLREQVQGWNYVQTKLTETGLTEERPSKVNDDFPDCLKGLFHYFGQTPTPLTKIEAREAALPAPLQNREKILAENPEQAERVMLARQMAFGSMDQQDAKRRAQVSKHRPMVPTIRMRKR